MKKLLSVLFTVFLTGVLFAQTKEVIIPIDMNTRQNISSSIFVDVEEMPTFKYKDCKTTQECFTRYVGDHIKFPPATCVDKGYVQFVVEPDSTIGNVRIIHGLDNCQEYGEEVVKIISTMPKWIPGRQKGKVVRVMMTMPIVFQINE